MNDINFNDLQKQAIEADLGAVLVIAGAGSGKTRVLTYRYKYIIDHFDFHIDEVLAITFTNKAANEMKQRLSDLLPSNNFLWVGTFHNICLKILREDIDKLNRNRNFSIIDDEDQINIIRDIYKLLINKNASLAEKLNTKHYPYKVIISLIEKIKTHRFLKDDVYNEVNWKYLNINDSKDCNLKWQIFNNYQQELLHNNYLDFNDLLILTNDLLKNEVVLNKWANKFKYVLVDEFQDTNDEQYEFIKKITSINHNIFVVGDPDQMIYSWRGANLSIINNFAKTFTNTKVIILNQNYRSTQAILDVSNALIKHNQHRIHKDLISNNQLNSNENKPIYFNASNQNEESRWVINKILDLVENQKVDYAQIAILYRSNYLSRNIENELVLNGINYVIYGGTKFYQRREIKDIIAYLKVLFLGDDISLKRILNVPKRGISPAAIELIYEYAKTNDTSMLNAIYCYHEIEGLSSIAKKGINEFIQLIDSINLNQKLVDVFDEIITKTQYKEYLKNNEEANRIANIDELKASILQYQLDNPHNSYIDYLQEVSILSTQADDNQNKLSLMTIHSAKGLEFNYVFLIGLNEGIFPSHRSIDNLEHLEEERRIAYVAITRAKKQLYISTFGGFNYLDQSPNRPSQFINEIPKSLLSTPSIKIKNISDYDSDWYDSKKIVKKDYQANYSNQSPDFHLGDHVVHTIYGEGIIIGVNDFTVDVSFKPPYNKKTIVSNHKSLKRKIELN